MALEAVDLVAELVVDDDVVQEVRGQVAVATTPGRVTSVALDPPSPAPCPEAVRAIERAHVVVLGPGSWFTSVVPHLLVPQMREALAATSAFRIVTLNLVPQQGETVGFSPQNHLEVLSSYAPELTIDAVIADRSSVADVAGLREAAAALGGELFLDDVRDPGIEGVHEPAALAAAYRQAWERGRIKP